MKRMIVSTKTIQYKDCSIYDTGFGYKLYKDGHLASNVEYESFDEAAADIDDDFEDEVMVTAPELEEPVDWLSEFSQYAFNLPGRIYPNSDGLYSTNRRATESYLKAFKKKNPECDLEIHSRLDHDRYVSVVY